MTQLAPQSTGFSAAVKRFLKTITIEPMILLFVFSFSVISSTQIMTDLLIDKMCRMEELTAVVHMAGDKELFNSSSQMGHKELFNSSREVLSEMSSNSICDNLSDDQEFRDIGEGEKMFCCIFTCIYYSYAAWNVLKVIQSQ